jgi:hypothetical protein
LTVGNAGGRPQRGQRGLSLVFGIKLSATVIAVSVETLRRHGQT